MRNYRQGRIKVKDRSTPTAKELILIYDGNFSLDIPGVEVTAAKDRGELNGTPEFLLGDEKEMSATLEARIVGDMTDDDEATLMDILAGEFGTGYIASDWVSGSDICLTVDIEWDDNKGTGHGFILLDCILRGKYTNGADGNVIAATVMVPHAYPVLF